jgi:hypothetical protein
VIAVIIRLTYNITDVLGRKLWPDKQDGINVGIGSAIGRFLDWSKKKDGCYILIV